MLMLMCGMLVHKAGPAGRTADAGWRRPGGQPRGVIDHTGQEWLHVGRHLRCGRCAARLRLQSKRPRELLHLRLVEVLRKEIGGVLLAPALVQAEGAVAKPLLHP